MKGNGNEEATLRRLRQLGVKVVIDDFGIGFSSLNQLKNLAIDGLKIDRSFVCDMIDDEGAMPRSCRRCIGIGKSLRIDVLAEGVESQRHVDCLLDLGCDGGQGRPAAEPMPAAQCTGCCAARRPRSSEALRGVEDLLERRRARLRPARSRA